MEQMFCKIVEQMFYKVAGLGLKFIYASFVKYFNANYDHCNIHYKSVQ